MLMLDKRKKNLNSSFICEFFFVFLFQFRNGRFVPTRRVLDTTLDYDTVTSVVCHMPSASQISGTSSRRIVNEPRHVKTCFLQVQKQNGRSAAQY